MSFPGEGYDNEYAPGEEHCRGIYMKVLYLLTNKNHCKEKMAVAEMQEFVGEGHALHPHAQHEQLLDDPFGYIVCSEYFPCKDHEKPHTSKDEKGLATKKKNAVQKLKLKE